MVSDLMSRLSGFDGPLRPFSGLSGFKYHSEHDAMASFASMANPDDAAGRRRPRFVFKQAPTDGSTFPFV